MVHPRLLAEELVEIDPIHLQGTDAFASPKKGYICIHVLAVLVAYPRSLVEELVEIDPGHLQDSPAFWVNVHNALLMHVRTSQCTLGSFIE